MGSRGRSIRLRIYFLVAIPLITMLGLFAYVAYGSVTNWLNLDRAPNLIKATSVPMTNFVSLLQAERRAAVVYLSHPDTASLNAYQTVDHDDQGRRAPARGRAQLGRHQEQHDRGGDCRHHHVGRRGQRHDRAAHRGHR